MAGSAVVFCPQEAAAIHPRRAYSACRTTACHHAGVLASHSTVGISSVCGGSASYHHENIAPYLPVLRIDCARAGPSPQIASVATITAIQERHHIAIVQKETRTAAPGRTEKPCNSLVNPRPCARTMAPTARCLEIAATRSMPMIGVAARCVNSVGGGSCT